MDDVLARPLPPTRAVLGLGSNVGDREAHIERAIASLHGLPAIHVINVARLYETPPFGGPSQGDYLNTAVLIETSLRPDELLSEVLAVELLLGRVRADGARWGPRTIDIDVLWIEGVFIDEETLRVPHPFLEERAFALRPLLDLVANARHPCTGFAYSELPVAVAPISVVPWKRDHEGSSPPR